MVMLMFGNIYVCKKQYLFQVHFSASVKSRVDTRSSVFLLNVFAIQNYRNTRFKLFTIAIPVLSDAILTTSLYSARALKQLQFSLPDKLAAP